MIRLVRITGFLLIAVGALLVLSYLVEPLREVWALVYELPLVIRIGLALAATGLLVLLGSLIWERYEERENDRSLLDEP